MKGIKRKTKLNFSTKKGGIISPAFKGTVPLAYWIYLKECPGDSFELIDLRNTDVQLSDRFFMMGPLERMKELKQLL